LISVRNGEIWQTLTARMRFPTLRGTPPSEMGLLEGLTFLSLQYRLSPLGVPLHSGPRVFPTFFSLLPSHYHISSVQHARQDLARPRNPEPRLC